MTFPWLRLYSEFAHDPKIQMMSEAMQRRYIMLLCLRGSNVTETLHETELAFALRISEEELAATKKLFVAKGFIDDEWTITNWDKRQMPSDSSTERVRAHRANKKQGGKKDETLQKRGETSHGTKGNVLEERRGDKNRGEEKREDQVLRAIDHDEKTQAQKPTSPRFEKGFTGTEKLEQSQEQFTAAVQNEDQNSSPIVPFDPITSRLRDKEPMEAVSGDDPNGDESGDATPPSTPQQGRVEPPMTGKVGQIQPCKVTDDGWPEGQDKADDIKTLLAEHVKSASGHAATYAVFQAMQARVEDVGGTEWEAYLYLAGRAEDYKAVRNKMPKSEWKFAVKAESFYNDGIYKQNAHQWGSDDDGSDEGKSDNSELLRSLRDGSWHSGSGGGLTPELGPEAIRASKAAFRESVMSRPRGLSGVRTF